jgi:hypothetical protein
MISRSIALSIPFAISDAPECLPYTLPRTTLASSVLFALTSHLGVSGKKTSIANCKSAGKAPIPTIHLHPWLLVDSIHPTTYATIWPPVTNKILSVTSRPLNGDGDSSDIYLLPHQPSSFTNQHSLPQPAPRTKAPPDSPPQPPNPQDSDRKSSPTHSSRKPATPLRGQTAHPPQARPSSARAYPPKRPRPDWPAARRGSWSW